MPTLGEIIATPAGKLLVGFFVLLAIGVVFLLLTAMGKKPTPAATPATPAPPPSPPANPQEIVQWDAQKLSQFVAVVEGNATLASQLQPEHWKQITLRQAVLMKEAAAAAKKAKEAQISAAGFNIPEPIALFASHLLGIGGVLYWAVVLLPLRLPVRELYFLTGSGFLVAFLAFAGDFAIEAFRKKENHTGATWSTVVGVAVLLLWGGAQLEAFPPTVSTYLVWLWVAAAVEGFALNNFVERFMKWAFPKKQAAPESAKK